MGFQCHNNLFERGISCTLTDAVDGTFYLPRAVLQTSQTVCRREPQIVVAMDGYNGLVDVFYVVFEILDFGTVLLGKAVTIGIRYVYYGCTGCNYGLNHASEVFIVCPSGILRIKLD